MKDGNEEEKTIFMFIIVIAVIVMAFFGGAQWGVDSMKEYTEQQIQAMNDTCLIYRDINIETNTPRINLSLS